MSKQQIEKDAQGYSPSTIEDLASRTVDSDASFLKPYIKPSDHILDVGCGPGTITCGFSMLIDSTKGGYVIGIDSSMDTIQRAREMAKERVPATIQLGNGNGHITSSSFGNGATIQFMKEDILDRLPFVSGAFSVIYANQMFRHLPTVRHRTAALKEMRRMLKPGGILATRDVAELHFYPPRCELDGIWAARMAHLRCRKQEDVCLPGGNMPVQFRAAGFGKRDDEDDNNNGGGNAAEVEYDQFGAPLPRPELATSDSGKVILGGGGDGAHGSRDGRLQSGERFRESWRRAGITDEEVQETVKALEEWAEDEDAWYVALQVEMLAWK
ncbi:hypothetical protein PG993_000287 [Apiospora rasikravindrae]|uniref:Methyltransferase type 11 domain-containing protein n=1 Tax=Apiospora rasikravindrae TaxID=990691 RepID=A0ABR1U853_9PEZI